VQAVDRFLSPEGKRRWPEDHRWFRAICFWGHGVGRQPIGRNSASQLAKGGVQNLASRVTGPIVLRHGYVKGMSRKVACEVLARKIPLDPKLKTRSHEYTYSDCCVIDAPADLPEGEYLVHFDEHVIAATKKGTYWLSRGTAEPYRDAIFLASQPGSRRV
jgi:hypothetical protein